MKTKKLALTALFIALAAGLSALETLLPPICPIAGVRIGLGNTVTLFVLYSGGMWRGRDALCIAVLRCFVAALITGALMNAVYGLAGGIFAFGGMMAARGFFPRENGRYRLSYMPFTSAAGAVCHIAGQMMTAVIFYGSLSVLAYTPLLLASAIVGGSFTGLCAMLLLKKLPARVLDGIRGA